MNKTVAVIALQGAFIEHLQIMQKFCTSATIIRNLDDLEKIRAQLAGIILPGGESTAQRKLLHKTNLFSAIQNLIKSGLPTLATCAGAILLAEKIASVNQSADLSSSQGQNLANSIKNTDKHKNDISQTAYEQNLQTLPITIKRNAFGRQQASFSYLGKVGNIAENFAQIYTRAPEIVEIADGVEVLSQLPDGKITAVRFENQFAFCYHPELAGDEIHHYFWEICKHYQN